MNCFEAHKHWDQAIRGKGLDPELESHLKTCSPCTTQQLRHQKIIAALRANLTVESPPLEQIQDWGAGLKIKDLDKAPWYVRSGVQTFAVTALILLGVALAPKIQSIYERALERRLEKFELPETALMEEEFVADTAQDDVAPGEENSSKSGDETCTPGKTTEICKVDAAPESDESVSGPLKVGPNEIWRFNIRTESPKDFRKSLMAEFKRLGISEKTEGFSGVSVPGGIQFNLLVPSQFILEIKDYLQKNATLQASGTKPSIAPSNRPFAWFKTKSRSPVDANHTRIVIWFSQF